MYKMRIFFSNQIANTLEEQIDLHNRLWLSDENNWIDAKDGMINMLKIQQKFIGSPSTEKLVLDLGAGRGNLSAALKEYGYHILACEPSVELYEKACKLFRFSSKEYKNITAMELLEEFDQNKKEYKHIIIYLWHVLEHMNDAINLLKAIKKLSVKYKVTVMIQLPSIRSEYIFKEHLFLATPDTCKFLSDILELKLIEFDFIKKSMFINCFYTNDTSLQEYQFNKNISSLNTTEKLLYFLSN